MFSGSAFKDKSCRKDVLGGDALKDESFKEDLFSGGASKRESCRGNCLAEVLSRRSHSCRGTCLAEVLSKRQTCGKDVFSGGDKAFRNFCSQQSPQR